MGRGHAPRIAPRSERAQIVLPGDYLGPEDGRLMQTTRALTAVIGLAPEDVTVVEVVAGAAEIDVPLWGLQRLRQRLEENDARLRMLQASRIRLEFGFGRREDWVLEEGRYRIRPPEPAPPRPPEPIRVHLVQPFLVAALVGCMAYAAAEFARIFWPEASTLFMTVAAMVAAVESGYSFQLIHRRRLSLDELIRFRAIELSLLVLLIKAGTWIGDSPAQIWETIRGWPHDPATLIDAETVLGLILGLVAWQTTTGVMRDLRRLGEPPERDRFYVSPLDSLAGRFFRGGGILVLLVGLVSIGRVAPEWTAGSSAWALVARLRRSTLPDMVLALLGYHGLGLVMLGQVRLGLLRKRWAAQSLEVDEALGRRWLTASLALMGLALLVSFLLPTAHTAGLLRALGRAIAWLAQGVAYLASLLVFLLSWLMAPLLSLLSRSGEELVPRDRAPRFEPPAPAPEPAGPPPEWLLAMRTVLFWGLAAAAVVAIVVTYLRDHPEVLAWATSRRPTVFLRRLWAALRRLWGRWEATIQRRLAKLAARAARGAAEVRRRPFRFLRLSALSPRERILYYYWSILKRAEGMGRPRRPGETPHEYRAALESRLPEVEAEVEDLTEAFVEARYSRHSVESADAQAVKKDWQRVSKSMRTLRRPAAAPTRETDGEPE
jgi:hypothetical protein